jgi:hypothetical protein
LSTVFYKLQLKYFKSFLVFASIAMILYSGLHFAFASRATINSITLDSENSILSKELENVLGKSYYQLTDNVLNSFTIVDQSIKTIQIINFSDNVLYLGVNYYEQVAVVEDYRSSPTTRNVLLKNGIYVDFKNEKLPKVSILNGPVEEGFEGELISFFTTLHSKSTDLNESKFTFDGTSFNGLIDELEINFGGLVDLGTKAASIFELLDSGTCKGTVIFVNSESFITSCNI